jgi:hypothetical protein
VILTHETSPDIRRVKQARGVSFIACIWIFVLLVMIFGFWPVAKGAMAKQTWDKIPCYLNEAKDKYFYSVNNVGYYSERFDFWDGFHQTSHALKSENVKHEPNTVCYVNKKDPLQAVLYPDSHTRVAGMMTRFKTFPLLIVAALGLTYFTRRKAKRRTDNPPAPATVES